MNKKLMAMAVASAFAVPAAASAATSNVQIYGRMQLTVDSAKATGATLSGHDVQSRTRVDDNSSRLGFKGTENLGGGLKAIFKMESGLNADTGDASRHVGTLASREGWVGLAGNWGSVTMGKQNVWWTNFADQTQANYINLGLQYATGGTGITTLGGPAHRVNNDIKYSSPNISGFHFWLNYAPQAEAAVAGSSATTANTTGVSAAYLSRQFIGQFDWAKNKLDAPTLTKPTVTGTKLGFGWKYQPGAIISLIWIKQDGDYGAGVKGHVNAWQLNWSQMTGNWQWIAQYGRSADITGDIAQSNTGSNGYTLAAKYHFSKRTGAYVSYTRVNNDKYGAYDYNGGGNPVGVNTKAADGLTAYGADPQVFGVGIQHNF